MQQLISIETIPISIKYVGKPLLPTTGEINTRAKNFNSEIDMEETKAPQAKLDSYAQGNPTGIHNLTYTASAQTSEDGKPQLNIQISGDGINEFSFYRFSRDMREMVSRILKAGGEGSSNGTNTPINLPDFKIEILENPEVIIKYVGGPIYIPKSADPNYDPARDLLTLQD